MIKPEFRILITSGADGEPRGWVMGETILQTGIHCEYYNFGLGGEDFYVTVNNKIMKWIKVTHPWEWGYFMKVGLWLILFCAPDIKTIIRVQ